MKFNFKTPSSFLVIPNNAPPRKNVLELKDKITENELWNKYVKRSHVVSDVCLILL